MTARSSMVAVAVSLGLALLSACAPRGVSGVAPLTAAEHAAIGDVIRRRYRELSELLRSRNGCDEIGSYIGAQHGSVATQGRVIDVPGSTEAVTMCRTLKGDRVAAREFINDERVEVLGRDAAMLITQSLYAEDFRDGSTVVREKVVTTVWVRSDSTWRHIHLHESW